MKTTIHVLSPYSKSVIHPKSRKDGEELFKFISQQNIYIMLNAMFVPLHVYFHIHFLSSNVKCAFSFCIQFILNKLFSKFIKIF